MLILLLVVVVPSGHGHFEEVGQAGILAKDAVLLPQVHKRGHTTESEGYPSDVFVEQPRLHQVC